MTDYISLPFLPQGREVSIEKIEILNWDCEQNRPLGWLAFNLFMEQDASNYVIGVNPVTGFIFNESVSPVVVHADGERYRVDCDLWYQLIDIHVAIVKIQEDVFPVTLLIDEPEYSHESGLSISDWLRVLYGIIGRDFRKFERRMISIANFGV